MWSSLVVAVITWYSYLPIKSVAITTNVWGLLWFVRNSFLNFLIGYIKTVIGTDQSVKRWHDYDDSSASWPNGDEWRVNTSWSCLTWKSTAILDMDVIPAEYKILVNQLYKPLIICVFRLYHDCLKTNVSDNYSLGGICLYFGPLSVDHASLSWVECKRRSEMVNKFSYFPHQHAISV
jgi:hypothetical protein